MTAILIVLLLWIYACGAAAIWLVFDDYHGRQQRPVTILLTVIWPLTSMMLSFAMFGGSRGYKFLNWLERRFGK